MCGFELGSMSGSGFVGGWACGDDGVKGGCDIDSWMPLLMITVWIVISRCEGPGAVVCVVVDVRKERAVDFAALCFFYQIR